MLMNIWVKDKSNDIIHQVGTDQHDSLELMDGKVQYLNMQNLCGTYGGEYEFLQEPENYDDYVSVTPNELKLNRQCLHRDLEKILSSQTANGEKGEL